MTFRPSLGGFCFGSSYGREWLKLRAHWRMPSGAAAGLTLFNSHSVWADLMGGKPVSARGYLVGYEREYQPLRKFACKQPRVIQATTRRTPSPGFAECTALAQHRNGNEFVYDI
jgi:hypothetical protein